MSENSEQGENRAHQDKDEIPAIYSIHRTADGHTFNRRTFLEIASAAVGTAALSGGCAYLGGQTGPMIAHKDAVTALAVSDTGNLLASGDKKGNLKLWQLPEGALLHSWSGHSSAVSGLFFPLADDVLWSLNSTGTLKRWQLPSGDKVSDGKSIRGTNHAHLFAISSDSDWYAVCNSPQSIELRSPTTGRTQRRLERFEDKVSALAACQHANLLLIGGSNGSLGLWTESAGTKVRTVKAGSAVISTLALDPKGTLGLSAHADGRLRTWQMPELHMGTTYESTLGKPFSVAIRPQLDLFVVGSEKPQIGLYRVAASAARPQRLAGHAAAVRATVITPDGSLLISGSDDKTIRLWSLPDGKHLRNLVDLAVNYKYVKGTGYKGKDIYGRTVTFTLPCGSPIPPGAVCTCNCVPGAITIPRNHTQRYNSYGYCTCDLICTCNTVCTCQSVGGHYISYWYPN